MQAALKKRFVVIFQSENFENDNKYVNLLNEEGITAKNIATLSFVFTNVDKLKLCLERPDDYSGIIFTSTRAVNSIVNALESCPVIKQWRNKLCFSVGESTSKVAMSLLNLETHGSDSGNSANLCDVIIEKCRNIDKPLLFPCSNIRRNTIPDTLSNHSIQIEEIVSYESVPNAEFKEQWKDLTTEEGLPEILVFFSPSGVKNCFETTMKSYSDNVKPKFIALGPSTEKALMENNIECAVAEKPNPECVLHVVKELLLL